MKYEVLFKFAAGFEVYQKFCHAYFDDWSIANYFCDLLSTDSSISFCKIIEVKECESK